MENVKINFESLFELDRIEKSRQDLQKIDQGFYEEVEHYLREKERFLREQEGRGGLYTDRESSKTRTQIENTKRIIRNIYEKREKKIISLALIKSRTNMKGIDTSKMLPEELSFFNELVGLLDVYRKKVHDLLYQNGRAKETHLPDKEGIDGPAGEKEIRREGKPAEEGETSGEIPEASYNLEFIADVGKFLGPDLKAYGPFKEGEMATLPVNVAEMVISNGKAKKREEKEDN